MKIVVIGGGAAGFIAAITAAEHNPKADILILEKNRTVLNKVRISGGGRCNVTHACFENKVLIKNYPRGEHFLRKLLPTFSVKDTIAWFERRGVQLKTETDGRMFPVTDSSETVIRCLMQAASDHGIRIRSSTPVLSFEQHPADSDTERFTLHLPEGEVIVADRLLIATGGHPQQKGYDWVATHSHEVIAPVPSLFTFNVPDSYLLPLSGVSVQDTLIRLAGTPYEWRGPLLLTHWGFSGPAILKLSAWGARVLAEKNYHFTCRINWLPDQSEEAVRAFLIQQKTATPKQQIASHARFGLPLRLWKAFLQQVEIPENLRWSEAPHKPLNKLATLLTNSQFEVKGKSTFKEEFVTAGGVALTAIHTDTLESKHVPGLYFAGEILDVDGITGGFNFQNAWTTGYIAGTMMAKS